MEIDILKKKVWKTIALLSIAFLILGPKASFAAIDLAETQSYTLRNKLKIQDPSGADKYAPAGASFTVSKKSDNGSYTITFTDPGNSNALPATDQKDAVVKGVVYTLMKLEADGADVTRAITLTSGNGLSLQDNAILTGDRFYIDVDAGNFVPAEGDTKTPVCAPSGSVFKVVGDNGISDSSGQIKAPSDTETRKIWVKFLHIGDTVEDNTEGLKLMPAFFKSPATTDRCKEKSSQVNPNLVYVLEVTRLTTLAYERSGLIHGALVIPYKFHRSDHNLGGEQTIGYYVGKRVASAGSSFALVGSAGLSLISIQSSQSGSAQPTTTTKSALSLAAGGLFTITKGSVPFQTGFFIGYDMAGKSAGYQYEARPWFAIAVGFDFSR